MIYARSLVDLLRDWNSQQLAARVAYYDLRADQDSHACPCGALIAPLARKCDLCKKATRRANDRARYQRKKAQP